MVFVWMMIAVSPRVRDRLSVVMVRVTLHEVSPIAIAIDVAIANARYLIALTRRCFCVSVSGFMFLWFCALWAGCVTLWSYVGLAEVVCVLRRWSRPWRGGNPRQQGRLWVITCRFRFLGEPRSKRTDRKSCTWFGGWSRLGQLEESLDPSYGRE